MTVTKGKKTYSFPVGSAQNSDVESLHLGSTSASDNESLHNEPMHNNRPFIPPTGKSTKTEEQMILKKNCGRKKLRRYRNSYSLQTLVEDEDNEGTLIVIMEPYKTRFHKLFEDEDALLFWNNFIEKSEEEQAEFIQVFSNRSHDLKTVTTNKHAARISSKIKRTIKIKRNLSLEQVKCCEGDLIGFFKRAPDQVYIKYTSTYFERLLLHAVAEYHGLQSVGIMENGAKRIEVYNTTTNWIPRDCCLVDVVAQLQK